MCFIGKRYVHVMETRVLKLIKLTLVLEVAIFGPFKLAISGLLYYCKSFFNAGRVCGAVCVCVCVCVCVYVCMCVCV